MWGLADCPSFAWKDLQNLLTAQFVQGVIKLIDAAKKAGVKKFVLQTSILTNGKAIGEGLNPIFLVLNAVTGALDKKLEVKQTAFKERT